MRERRVQRGQKEWAGLQQNKNEIGHMKYVINGSSCSWAGLASCLALSGSCRLAWFDWLGWEAHGSKAKGKMGKLWNTVVEVKATKKLRKSESGFSSINQSRRIPSRERGNGLAPGQPRQKMPCSPSASEVKEVHRDPPELCPLDWRNQRAENWDLAL